MPLDTNLHKKAYAGDKNSCEDLLDEGEDVNVRGAQNRTALHRAAGANHVAVCEFLLSKGADPSICDDSGRTALHWAALGGAADVAELFKMIDVNAKSKSGSTALHLSAESGKLDFVNWLLAHGADPIKDTTPPDGKTAYQLAKDKNLEPIMASLKAAGGAIGELAASGCCIIM